jgi:hypothetical protein
LNKGRYIDCPSSVGKPSPLQDTYWKLKKSESVQEQKLAATFSRRHSYASLIQVIRDENNTDLEGKILVWRYGVKIWEKINAELKPVIGDKHDPFNILEGKAFALVISIVSGFNNYDQSKFVDKKIPLCIPNEEGKLIPISETSDKQEVFNWVKENSPDLSEYSYKEWDNDTFEYVNSVINSVTGKAEAPQKYDSIVNRDKSSSSVPTPSEDSGISSTDLDLDDLDIGDGNTDLDIPDLNNSSDDGGIVGIEGDLDDIIGNT